MCKHCENLVEDKDVVHRFFEVGAARLNEMLPKRIGMPLHRPVTADDIEAPTLTVHATFWRENPLQTIHGYQLLDEMDDSGYYRRGPSEEEQLRDPENRKRLEAMLNEMANLPHPDEKK
jgi:hypothetical protein